MLPARYLGRPLTSKRFLTMVQTGNSNTMKQFSLFFYDSEPSLIPFTFSHGLEIIDYLEDMPFPVANAGSGSIPTNSELFEEKLERWATFIPL